QCNAARNDVIRGPFGSWIASFREGCVATGPFAVPVVRLAFDQQGGLWKTLVIHRQDTGLFPFLRTGRPS
ncbi:MAG: hypothetical protein AB7O92_17785, partial [Acidimicrobiia bacterium]